MIMLVNQYWICDEVDITKWEVLCQEAKPTALARDTVHPNKRSIVVDDMSKVDYNTRVQICVRKISEMR